MIPQTSLCVRTIKRAILLLIVLACSSSLDYGNLLASPSSAIPNKNEKKDEGEGVVFREKPYEIEILVAGQPFTTYHFRGYNKPIFFPIRAASGTIVTRGYPMIRGIPGESNDHAHHKGLWLTHADVNGIDFWSEDPTGGSIVHRDFEVIRNGREVGVVQSRNDWISPEGNTVLEETRQVKVYNWPGVRAMDFDFQLAAVDGQVKFGDNSDGTFALRLAEPFVVNGRMENSHASVGEKNCWGKQADWVNYTATINGETLGVAVFDHPTSFRHPTHWHARGYGLFAANPFGLRDFYDDKTRDGSYVIQPGHPMILRYRLYIHPGTVEEARIADQYRAYANLRLEK
jgi:hypothetical protein